MVNIEYGYVIVNIRVPICNSQHRVPICNGQYRVTICNGQHRVHTFEKYSSITKLT